jgi:hypothetical protein
MSVVEVSEEAENLSFLGLFIFCEPIPFLIRIRIIIIELDPGSETSV